MINLSAYQTQLIDLCHRFSVKRLELVGSAAREDFQTDTSDIDMLIEFEGNQALFDRYFDLKAALERLFGRKVDVIQPNAIKNPFLRDALEQDRIPIYEA